MKTSHLSLFAVTTFALASLAVATAHSHGSPKAEIGEVTPSWNLKSSVGKTESIENLRGKYVVLEWTNPDCPFVRKHYESGNMQATQAEAKKLGAVWFTIDSSAPGKEGYLSPSEINAYRTQMHVHSDATLVDADGTVGHIYGAKTTPTIVILDPKGVMIYNGAIDNRPTADPADIPGATNYVLTSLHEAMAGKALSVSSTRSYGCSVKY